MSGKCGFWGHYVFSTLLATIYALLYKKSAFPLKWLLERAFLLFKCQQECTIVPLVILISIMILPSTLIPIVHFGPSFIGR